VAALPNASCATALGQIGDARALPSLVTALNTGEPGDRRAAAWALGQLGDEQALQPLVSALSDDEGDVRAAAAAALDRLGWQPEGTAAAPRYWVVTHQWDKAVHGAAVEPLIVALKDPAASVRERAAQTLGSIVDARAITPLSAALNDQDIDVAKAAARALVAMYSSGRLDDAQKAAVLAQRDRITFQDDVPEHEGVDVRDDRTIGVAFPI
jgi:HEAT repeat protein